MIRILLPLLFFTALSAFAQSTEVSNVTDATSTGAVTRASADTSDLSLEEKRNATEVGLLMSSINSGSTFANLAILRHLGDSWELGVRGLVPIDFQRDSQTYMGQAFLRYDFVNNENVFFVEANVFQGFFSAPEYDSSTRLFGGFGGTYGYRREFTPEFTAGVNLGVDYTSARIDHDRFNSYDWALVSRLAFVGGYNF